MLLTTKNKNKIKIRNPHIKQRAAKREAERDADDQQEYRDAKPQNHDRGRQLKMAVGYQINCCLTPEATMIQLYI